MRKAVVAGMALVLVSAAAFAAIRIGVYDVCPLTGRPLHRAPVAQSGVDCPATPGCPYEDERCRNATGAGANGSVISTAAPTIDQTMAAARARCPSASQSCSAATHDCCPEAKPQCCEEGQRKVATPPAKPAEPESRP